MQILLTEILRFNGCYNQITKFEPTHEMITCVVNKLYNQNDHSDNEEHYIVKKIMILLMKIKIMYIIIKIMLLMMKSH